MMVTSPAPAQSFLEMLANTGRHEKLGIFGPAVAALGQAYFLFAKRLAVGCAGVVFVRCAKPDMAVHDDQCRCIVRLPEPLDGLRQASPVIGVTDALQHSSHRRGSAAATSSLKARSVCPSMVIRLLS